MVVNFIHRERLFKMNSTSVEVKSLTILFTDMKGFTALTSIQSRQQMAKLLDLQEEIVRQTIKEFKGQMIKSLGDGYMATFESPTNAVLAGMKVQEKVSTHNATNSAIDQFEVRVVLNTGEVTVRGSDIFGEPVNITARILAAVEPGEVYLGEGVYLAMNRNEIPTVEVGTHLFKGIPEEIKIYKVAKEQSELIKHKITRGILAGLHSTLPKDKLIKTYRTNKKLLLGGALALFVALLFLFAEARSNKANDSDNNVYGLETSAPAETEATVSGELEEVLEKAEPTPTPTPFQTEEKNVEESQDNLIESFLKNARGKFKGIFKK